MKKANLRLMGLICPRIKHRIQSTVVFYQWFLIPITVLFVSCQALAQEVKVQQMPLAATVSTNDFKENSTPFKIDEVSPQKEQDTTFQEKITALNIGDKIPDELWEMYFPVVSTASEKEQYLSLGDFKDKLIILDFWATWCAPCISSLHKLDSLQKEFEGELKVIATSEDPAKKNRDFFIARGWDLPTMFDETTLKKYFPHGAIPHQVWIKDGKVNAIPKAHYATAENMVKVLSNEDVKMKMALDAAPFDNTKPMFMDGNGGRTGDKFYYSMVSNYAPDLPQKRGMDTLSIGDTTILAVYNWPITSLFYEAYKHEIDPELNKKSGVEWEVSHFSLETWASGPLKKDYSTLYDYDIAHANWLEEYWYCYNLFVSQEISMKEAKNIMQEDLNRYFGIHKGIHAFIETRPRKFAVLRVLESKEKTLGLLQGEKLESEDKVKFYTSNAIFSNFITMLYQAKLSDLSVLNKTGISGGEGVSYKISKGINGNLKDGAAALKRYGLELVEEEIQMPVLVIKEKSLIKI